jgi:hypothetical protein
VCVCGRSKQEPEMGVHISVEEQHWSSALQWSQSIIGVTINML